MICSKTHYNDHINVFTIITDLKISPSDFSKRLSEACDYASIPPLTQGRSAMLAEMLGINKRSVNYWFSGDSLPSSKKREKLAELLKVSRAYLEFGKGSLTDGLETENPQGLPVIPLALILTHDREKFEKRIIPNGITYSKNAFITIVEDDSMSPIAYSGTEIVVDPDAVLTNQKYILIYDKNDDTGYVRKIMLLANKVFITSLEPQASFQEIDPSHQEIIGKVIAIYNVY